MPQQIGPGIRECAAALNGPANGGSVEQNLRLFESKNVRYFLSNYDAGVPPASFF